MIKNYIKTALRNIRRYKGFAIINIAGLAVGMGCFILIFLWAYDECHYDSFHANSDRIYRIILKKADDPIDPGVPSSPYILPKILKDEYPEIMETTRVRTRGYKSAIHYKDIKNYESKFFLADSSFFSIFTYDFTSGNPENALDDPHSLVVTESAAKRYFGNEDPMGELIRWNNAQDLKVTGIIKKVPYNSHLQFDFMGSLQLYDEERLSSWWRETVAYIQLEKGVVTEKFCREISDFIQKHHPEDNYVVSLQPIREAHLNIAQGGRSDLQFVVILSMIAVMVLVIACVNYMNITSARSHVRALEVGMRKVVGAERSHIIGQFLGEAVIFSLLAFAAALVLVDITLPYFNRIQGKEMSLLSSANIFVYLGLAVLAVLTGFAAGSYPAFFISAFQPARILKKEIVSGRKGSLFRTILVITQFSISVLLIILTVVAYKQMHYIRNSDLGFNREQIIHIQTNDKLREEYKIFKEKLSLHPRILNTTFASAQPHLLFNVNNFTWEGMTKEKDVEINFMYVDHDYIKTFGLEIVAGRDFSEKFPTDALSAYLVNEAAVDFMGIPDPIGKRAALAGRPGKIIGIIKNFNHKPLIFNISPLVMGIRPSWFYDLMIKISSEDIPGSLAFIEKTFKEISPGFPFEYRFLDDQFEEIYYPLQIMNQILNWLAFLAVFISCLGLFGLASLLMEQKKREIGIRKVLGAPASGVILLLTKKFLGIIIISNIIAVPAAFFVSRKFLSFFVKRTSLSWDIIAITVISTFIAALITIIYHVVRTTRTDPVNVIHYE